jgi:1,4-dihydroxy-2-naphthoyl-CoA hydrolase
MDITLDQLNALTPGTFPGLVGFEVVGVARGRLRAVLPVRPEFLAPNGFLHAAFVVAGADTACGFGCRTTLPEGSTGFTTVELKSNFLGTALDGTIVVDASVLHAGRTTQVWDAEVRALSPDADAAPVHRLDDPVDGRLLAVFRCTQLVLWPRG